MFVGTVLIQVTSSKSVEAGIGTGPALDDIRLTALAVGKSGAGVERPKEWSLLWLVELRRGISYFLLANQVTKARRHARSGTSRVLLALLRRPLHWRLQNYFFAWPWELWLTMAQKWLTVRRSLLTGQPLSHELSRSA